MITSVPATIRLFKIRRRSASFIGVNLRIQSRVRRVVLMGMK